MLEASRYLDRSPVAHGTRCAKTSANLPPLNARLGRETGVAPGKPDLSPGAGHLDGGGVGGGERASPGPSAMRWSVPRR